MPKYRAKKLLKLSEAHGERAVMSHLKEATAKGELSLSDFSIKDLAITFLGENWAQKFMRQIGQENDGFALAEAGSPVKSSMFSNITGQLIFSEIRRGFEAEEFVFSRLVPTFQSRIDGTETVPSIAPMGDTAEVVGEGQEYPSVGISEVYYTLPAKVKRGHKIEITEETLFFDRTAMIVENAQKVGYYLGLNKEKEVIDCFSGQTNNYIRNGTATNTYLTSGAYINNASSVDLANWTDIDAAELLFANILDPDTSEPLADAPASERQIVVMPHRLHLAKQIVGATELRNTAVSTATFIAPNSVAPYGILTSRLLYNRVLATIEAVAGTAQAIWWLGSIQRLLGWYENWPLAMFRQGSESNAAFEKDVSLRFKARHRGVCAVREPRYMVRMENVAV